jgi:hypothetical protein
VACGAEGGCGYDNGVDAPVEPAAEPGLLAAPACERPIDRVGEAGRNEDSRQQCRRSQRQDRHDGCPCERDSVRQTETAERSPAVVHQHAEMPVGHRDHEQPPKRSGQRQPRTDGRDAGPGSETDDAGGESLAVLVAALAPRRASALERASEEAHPG